MTGIKLIAQERAEQLEKHGWSLERDDHYTDGELKKAALYLLTGDEYFWPESWSMEWLDTFNQKTEIEQLKIAGALLAAEIDRINRLDL